MFARIDRWVKYMLRGVQLQGVDCGAVRVSHLLLRYNRCVPSREQDAHHVAEEGATIDIEVIDMRDVR